MRVTAKVVLVALAGLWLQPAAAVGPGAATPDQPHNPHAVVKVDQQATKDRLEKKGKRSQSLDKARKPAANGGGGSGK